MAASVNKVILIGNLGKDPEVRFTQSGRAMCKFPIATSESWMSQSDGKQEKTTWHNIVVWGKQAESCGQYLSKGQPVYIEGSIDNRSYDDKEGNKRYVTDIKAQRVQFLQGRSGGGQQSSESGSGFDDFGAGSIPPDDDVPF